MTLALCVVFNGWCDGYRRTTGHGMFGIVEDDCGTRFAISSPTVEFLVFIRVNERQDLENTLQYILTKQNVKINTYKP